MLKSAGGVTASGGTPVWLSILLAAVTLAGVLTSALFLRKTGREARTSAQELDRRGKREETMRTLRWAAERATAEDGRQSRMGLAALDSIGGSSWLEVEDQGLIDAVVGSLTTSDFEAYRGIGTPTVLEQARADNTDTPHTDIRRTQDESGGA
ncbi:MAG TPA: hypothetical protein VIJ11_05070 [Galbitalea sp.]